MDDKMQKPDLMNAGLMAPCGMNCALCYAYLKEKNHCSGCLNENKNKPQHCITCGIKNCDNTTGQNEIRYCYECGDFPCKRLKQLDKRYKTKYGMSMITNLETIKQSGMELFIDSEKSKWTCPHCGGILSVHKDNCLFCNWKHNSESIN